jgi:hypothetical protein
MAYVAITVFLEQSAIMRIDNGVSTVPIWVDSTRRKGAIVLLLLVGGTGIEPVAPAV